MGYTYDLKKYKEEGEEEELELQENKEHEDVHVIKSR